MPPKKNEEKISEIIEEALRPIKDAMKDIVTNEAIANHIQKLEDKLISKLENQAEEIKNLRSRHNELEGRIAVLENLVKLQEIKSDDVEQYSRRLCLRVNDIPLKSAETNRDLENQLENEFINMGLNIPKEAIDRVHRVGRKYEVDEVDRDGVVTGVSLKQQVIIRFSTWSHRTQVYKARKRSKFMKFKVDLTKRRVNLLSRARSLIENVEGIDFVFADVNCRLNVKFSDERVKAFNTETELANIIAGCDAN